MRRGCPQRFVFRPYHVFLGVVVAFEFFAVSSAAQVSQRVPPADASSYARQGIGLAEEGRCKEALPLLKRATPRIADKELKFTAVMASAQCAMSLNQVDAALEALAVLNREFPGDPRVLYTTTHYCSELANRSAQELANTAPSSYQAQELDAEAYEAHGKWGEAATEYSKILEQNPQLPGIHFRLGRILLAKPPTPTTADDARKEFEAELTIDPNNAAAEFMLGDLSRQAQQWDEAIRHFSRASKLDAGFSEAYLGLGIAFNSVGRFSDAIPPLETYVRMYPPDPAGHYQLAIAYARTGRKDGAAREMTLRHQLDERANKEKNNDQPAPETQPNIPPQQ
jgi:predicted Zn-dependent protease